MKTLKVVATAVVWIFISLLLFNSLQAFERKMGWFVNFALPSSVEIDTHSKTVSTDTIVSSYDVKISSLSVYLDTNYDEEMVTTSDGRYSALAEEARIATEALCRNNVATGDVFLLDIAGVRWNLSLPINSKRHCDLTAIESTTSNSLDAVFNSEKLDHNSIQLGYNFEKFRVSFMNQQWRGEQKKLESQIILADYFLPYGFHLGAGWSQSSFGSSSQTKPVFNFGYRKTLSNRLSIELGYLLYTVDLTNTTISTGEPEKSYTTLADDETSDQNITIIQGNSVIGTLAGASLSPTRTVTTTKSTSQSTTAKISPMLLLSLSISF